jgi:Spy/CpxP family protein refolding chaperone
MSIVKNLSKVIGLAAAGVLFAGSVFANADYAAKKDELMKSLNLTAEQQTQVDDIMAKSHADREAIMKKYDNMKGPEKMKAMRPDVEALHAKTQGELAKVLNDEQMEKVMQFQDEMMASAKAKMGK